MSHFTALAELYLTLIVETLKIVFFKMKKYLIIFLIYAYGISSFSVNAVNHEFNEEPLNSSSDKKKKNRSQKRKDRTLSSEDEATEKQKDIKRFRTNKTTTRDKNNTNASSSDSFLNTNDNDYDNDSESEDGYEYKGFSEDLIKPSSAISSSNIHDNEQSSYIVLARGVHLLPDVFSDKRNDNKDKNSKKNTEENSKNIKINKSLLTIEEEGKSLFSSCVYKLSGLSFGEIPEESKLVKLVNNGKNIRGLFEEFKKRDEQLHHSFQEIYTNDHKRYHKSLKEPDFKTKKKEKNKLEQKKAFKKYRDLFQDKIENIIIDQEESPAYRNPNVSFSLIIEEGFKYAYGMKSFHSESGGNANPLLPDYDKDGRPHHTYLGKIYIALIPFDDFEKHLPYNVLQNHALGKIKVRTHPARLILREGEVSFHGYFPGEYIVCTLKARCPRFDGEYKPFYKEKYDIDEKSYKKYKDLACRGLLYSLDSKDDLSE
ncbi:MAG: hypothetical protein H0W50_11135, partial [Parachlamydiaceae bacterium]|nr:hypothetical protein [Parachlamydiaceae bacterium]